MHHDPSHDVESELQTALRELYIQWARKFRCVLVKGNDTGNRAASRWQDSSKGRSQPFQESTGPTCRNISPYKGNRCLRKQSLQSTEVTCLAPLSLAAVPFAGVRV
jgi:hypothetical protein